MSDDELEAQIRQRLYGERRYVTRIEPAPSAPHEFRAECLVPDPDEAPPARTESPERPVGVGEAASAMRDG